jgi:hypothetical protein
MNITNSLPFLIDDLGILTSDLLNYTSSRLKLVFTSSKAFYALAVEIKSNL